MRCRGKSCPAKASKIKGADDYGASILAHGGYLLHGRSARVSIDVPRDRITRRAYDLGRRVFRGLHGFGFGKIIPSRLINEGSELCR